MRGKRVSHCDLVGLLGITPACAGKTDSLAARWGGVQDHPRVCGENATVAIVSSTSLGSPPRVRGKRRELYTAPFIWRITPACAGKTIPLGNVVDLLQDHPRVCGENPRRCARIFRLGGSPPRVRGKLYPDTSGWQRARITPACAGKTIRKAPF